MRRWRVVLALIVLLASPLAAQEAPDHWSGLDRLEGTWAGQGKGFGRTAPVRHTWSFVFDRTFLCLESVSGNAGDERGDVGYLSFDTDTGARVFRQFFSEGFVNTYDVRNPPEDPDRLLFEYREAESAGPMKARLVLEFTDEDAYTMTLELASGEDAFAPCQTMEMKRQ